MSNNISYSEIPRHTVSENLDIILSGPIPPNPLELIGTKKCEELLHNLSLEYDYVFIDTPPVGIVSDTLILSKYCNICLFIVRHNKTKTASFAIALKEMKKGGIENFHLVINDVPQASKLFGYNREYGYNYAYNYK
ncbi:MAG: hypothetical protein IPO21_06545 [Bacteroidales bacterium]|nr:hypothetical protein [Bacteroidales bacterium]